MAGRKRRVSSQVTSGFPSAWIHAGQRPAIRANLPSNMSTLGLACGSSPFNDASSPINEETSPDPSLSYRSSRYSPPHLSHYSESRINPLNAQRYVVQPIVWPSESMEPYRIAQAYQYPSHVSVFNCCANIRRCCYDPPPKRPRHERDRVLSVAEYIAKKSAQEAMFQSSRSYRNALTKLQPPPPLVRLSGKGKKTGQKTEASKLRRPEKETQKMTFVKEGQPQRVLKQSVYKKNHIAQSSVHGLHDKPPKIISPTENKVSICDTVSCSEAQRDCTSENRNCGSRPSIPRGEIQRRYIDRLRDEHKKTQAKRCEDLQGSRNIPNNQDQSYRPILHNKPETNSATLRDEHAKTSRPSFTIYNEPLKDRNSHLDQHQKNEFMVGSRSKQCRTTPCDGRFNRRITLNDLNHASPSMKHGGPQRRSTFPQVCPPKKFGRPQTSRNLDKVQPSLGKECSKEPIKCQIKEESGNLGSCTQKCSTIPQVCPTKTFGRPQTSRNLEEVQASLGKECSKEPIKCQIKEESDNLGSCTQKCSTVAQVCPPKTFGRPQTSRNLEEVQASLGKECSKEPTKCKIKEELDNLGSCTQTCSAIPQVCPPKIFGRPQTSRNLEEVQPSLDKECSREATKCLPIEDELDNLGSCTQKCKDVTVCTTETSSRSRFPSDDFGGEVNTFVKSRKLEQRADPLSSRHSTPLRHILPLPLPASDIQEESITSSCGGYAYDHGSLPRIIAVHTFEGANDQAASESDALSGTDGMCVKEKSHLPSAEKQQWTELLRKLASEVCIPGGTHDNTASFQREGTAHTKTSSSNGHVSTAGIHVTHHQQSSDSSDIAASLQKKRESRDNSRGSERIAGYQGPDEQHGSYIDQLRATSRKYGLDRKETPHEQNYNKMPKFPPKKVTVQELSRKILETRCRTEQEQINWKKKLLRSLEAVLIKKLRKLEKETGEKADIIIVENEADKDGGKVANGQKKRNGQKKPAKGKKENTKKSKRA